jgi:hypothetical protein
MDTETTGAEKELPEQEAPRRSGRLPPLEITSMTKLIHLQSDLKTMSKESKSSEIYKM